MPTHHFHLASKDLDSSSLASVASTLDYCLPAPGVSGANKGDVVKWKQIWVVFMRWAFHIFVCVGATMCPTLPESLQKATREKSTRTPAVVRHTGRHNTAENWKAVLLEGLTAVGRL